MAPNAIDSVSLNKRKKMEELQLQQAQQMLDKPLISTPKYDTGKDAVKNVDGTGAVPSNSNVQPANSQTSAGTVGNYNVFDIYHQNNNTTVPYDPASTPTTTDGFQRNPYNYNADVTIPYRRGVNPSESGENYANELTQRQAETPQGQIPEQVPANTGLFSSVVVNPVNNVETPNSDKSQEQTVATAGNTDRTNVASNFIATKPLEMVSPQETNNSTVSDPSHLTVDGKMPEGAVNNEHNVISYNIDQVLASQQTPQTTVPYNASTPTETPSTSKELAFTETQRPNTPNYVSTPDGQPRDNNSDEVKYPKRNLLLMG